MQVAKGQVLMSLNDKDVEVFYKVDNIWQDKGGATWLSLKGIMSEKNTDNLPLMYVEKSYMQVSETTAKILFGSKV